MAHDGKTQREAAERRAARRCARPPERRMPSLDGAGRCGYARRGARQAGGLRLCPATATPTAANQRRRGGAERRRRAPGQAARRPVRRAPQIAANDDAPSIGGLIFALQQKPSNQPFHDGGRRLRRLARHRRPAGLGHAGAGDRSAPERRRRPHQPDDGRGAGHHLPADRAVLVPGAARLARAGAEADVLGHDRGGRAAGRARSRAPSSPRPRSARPCAGRSRS